MGYLTSGPLNCRWVIPRSMMDAWGIPSTNNRLSGLSAILKCSAVTRMYVCVWVGGEVGNDRGLFQINVWTLILKASANYGNCSPGYSDSGQDCGRNPQKINHMHCRCADWLGGKSIGCAGSCVCVFTWHIMRVREDLFNWRKKTEMRARLDINSMSRVCVGFATCA